MGRGEAKGSAGRVGDLEQLKSEVSHFLQLRGLFKLPDCNSNLLKLSKSSLAVEGFCCYQIKFKEIMGNPTKLRSAPPNLLE